MHESTRMNANVSSLWIWTTWVRENELCPFATNSRVAECSFKFPFNIPMYFPPWKWHYREKLKELSMQHSLDKISIVSALYIVGNTRMRTGLRKGGGGAERTKAILKTTLVWVFCWHESSPGIAVKEVCLRKLAWTGSSIRESLLPYMLSGKYLSKIGSGWRIRRDKRYTYMLRIPQRDVEEGSQFVDSPHYVWSELQADNSYIKSLHIQGLTRDEGWWLKEYHSTYLKDIVDLPIKTLIQSESLRRFVPQKGRRTY